VCESKREREERKKKRENMYADKRKGLGEQVPGGLLGSSRTYLGWATVSTRVMQCRKKKEET
jgi:hypothetical protein